MEQVYILDKLDPAKLNINQGAFSELKRLEMISVNSNPSSWNTKDDGIHLASINCAGLPAHITDMRADQKLLNADLIQVQETSLSTDEQGQNSCQIPGYEANFASVGNGKGIASYTKKSLVFDCIKEPLYQISLLRGEVDYINVYRSSGAHDAKVIETLRRMIDEG